MTAARSFLAISWLGDRPPRTDAAEGIAGTEPAARQEHPGTLWAWAPASAGDMSARAPSTDRLALQLPGPEAEHGSDSEQGEPPSAMAHRRKDGSVSVSVDRMGFRHVYIGQGPGWAAISTSARSLAILSDARVNVDTVDAQSLLGWQTGLATIFAGVTKVPPGGVAILDNGQVRIEPGQPFPPAGSFEGTLDDAVRHAASLVRANVERALAVHPELLLQLTGGLDSRILLAAIPPSRRPDVRCLTLAVPGSPDVEIAAQLTMRHGMSHELVRFGALDELLPHDAERLVLDASRTLDAAADPVALAALSLVEGRLESVPRLSGLGGEVVRGFYYVAPPLRGRRREDKVRRLARWRLFPNESVPDEVLHPRLRDGRRDRAVAGLQLIFDGYSAHWNEATDQFYLGQRMHRWAGVLASARCADRLVVNPMLDPKFLELGASLPISWKANARFLSRILVELDEELAQIPLDGRPAPAIYAQPGLRNLATFTALTGRKVVGKARQRLSSTGRPAAGGTTLSDLVVRAWREDPAQLESVKLLDVLDPMWLDAMLAGGHPTPSAVALTANLQTVAEVVSQQP